jgi:thiol-disulfide isomerase/thioredoxin
MIFSNLIFIPNLGPLKTIRKIAMKDKIKFIAVGWFLVTFCFSGQAFSQGYEIKIKVNGLQDTTVILGHYLNKSMYPDDTANIDKKGNGVFKGEKPLPGGMYIIYLPSTKYFEMIMGSDQKFMLKTDTTDFINTLSFEGSDENQIFREFQRFIVDLRQKADSIQSLIKTAKSDADKEKLFEQSKLINDTRITYIDKINAAHPNLFVSTFLKATLDISVPDAPRDKNGNVTDSTWQYLYYRNHYFDNFNLADPRLLRTPLYEDKLMTYITKVIPQIPDSLIVETDKLIEKTKSDSDLFRYMMITLFNYYGKSNYMGMDAVQIHIAEKYYIPDAWWSDPKFITDLKERVEKTKPLLIGKTAPDFELMLIPAEHFLKAENDTAMKRFPHVGRQTKLSLVDAEYLVLIFWEADCGHCKTAVPKLYEIYESKLKALDVKVLAVSTLFGEEGKIKWVDFVNAHKLYDWMNAWYPYSYDYKIRYDIQTTPQIYILDKNKKIIAKRIGVEQIEDIIKTFRGTN